MLALGFAALGAAALLRRRPRPLHGEARWASGFEIRRYGLFGSAGIVIGKYRRRFLIFDGTKGGKNVMIAAPPGSGKTAGVMLPNCLNWDQSLVALDLKGECFARTAGYRADRGHAVHRIEFAAPDGRSDQYNPFAYVSDQPEFRTGEVERIARYLCPDPATGDSFWASSARDMFRALVLYLFESDAAVSLGALRDLIEVPEGLEAFCRNVVKREYENDRKAESGLSAAVIRDLATIANRAENTHSGIKDQLLSGLAPLTNPLVRNVTAGNTFDLRDLRRRKMSIYLVVARPDLPALRPLINLFIQQLVDLHTRVEFSADPAHRYEILLALDEFAQIGRLDAVFHGITYFRSFGLRLLAIVQSPAQLREIYSIEAARGFEQCFECRLFFTPAASDLETAETLSRLLGHDTVKGVSTSAKAAWLSWTPSGRTMSAQRRPLMLPQEVLRLPAHQQVILLSGLLPILADKLSVWREPVFQQRSGVPPMIEPLPSPIIPVSPAATLTSNSSRAGPLLAEEQRALAQRFLDATRSRG
jgi:type IV secretion system protein VirD4